MNLQEELDRLRKGYAEDLPATLSRLQEAWDRLSHQWDISNLVSIHRIAHTLGGSAGSFGFSNLGNEARTLSQLLAPWVKDPNKSPPGDGFYQEGLRILEILQKAFLSPDSISEAAPLATPPMPFSGKDRPLVFVLDDDPALGAFLQTLLSFPYETRVFTRTQDALDALQTASPALILSDINMPGMDGWAFCERFRQEERFRFLPFIFLTERGGLGDKVQALETGADAYLTKPVVPEELLATVKNVLKRAEGFRSTLSLDPLTGSYNRRYLEKWAPPKGACAMIDIDHFKIINDGYGHPTGDLILRGVVEMIRRNIRKEDVLIRYGGEEFLLLLPGQEAETAFAVVERIRAVIDSKVFMDSTGKHRLHVTISSGLSKVSPEQPLNAAIDLADRRLYLAKERGRNRTVGAEEAGHAR